MLKLHKHEPHDKTASKDRVSWSRSPGTLANCTHESWTTTCVSSLVETGHLPPAGAWVSSHYLQVWTATIRQFVIISAQRVRAKSCRRSLMSVAIPQVQFWSKVVVLPVVVQRQVLMVIRHKRCHMWVGFVAVLLSKLPTYHVPRFMEKIMQFAGLRWWLVCRLSYGVHKSPGTGLGSFAVCFSGGSAPAQAGNRKHLCCECFVRRDPLVLKSGGRLEFKHNLFAHVPKDPNCEVCKMTKVYRAQCRSQLDA